MRTESSLTIVATCLSVRSAPGGYSDTALWLTLCCRVGINGTVLAVLQAATATASSTQPRDVLRAVAALLHRIAPLLVALLCSREDRLDLLTATKDTVFCGCRSCCRARRSCCRCCTSRPWTWSTKTSCCRYARVRDSVGWWLSLMRFVVVVVAVGTRDQGGYAGPRRAVPDPCALSLR